MGNILCCFYDPKPTYYTRQVNRSHCSQNYNRRHHASGTTNRSAVSKSAKNVPRAEPSLVVPVQPRSRTDEREKPTPRPPTHNHNQIRSGSGHRSAATAVKSKNCDACGESDHTTSNCRYSTRLCFHCRQEGHIIRICPERKKEKKRSRAEYFRNKAKTLVVAHPYQNYMVSNKKLQKRPRRAANLSGPNKAKPTPAPEMYEEHASHLSTVVPTYLQACGVNPGHRSGQLSHSAPSKTSLMMTPCNRGEERDGNQCVP